MAVTTKRITEDPVEAVLGEEENLSTRQRQGRKEGGRKVLV